MMPRDETLEREWTDFEAASTYEYAQSMLQTQNSSTKPTIENETKRARCDQTELHLHRDVFSRVYQSLAQMNTSLVAIQRSMNSSSR